MRISRLFFLLIALATVTLPHVVWAQVSTVRITEAFVPPAAAGRATAAYLKLQGGPDRLVSARSDSAGRVELHETVVENGATAMRPVGGVIINPGIATQFGPGGLHVMLSDLRHTLKEGETLSLTLTFERAGKATIAIPIARNAAAVRPSAAIPGLRGSPR